MDPFAVLIARRLSCQTDDGPHVESQGGPDGIFWQDFHHSMALQNPGPAVVGCLEDEERDLNPCGIRSKNVQAPRSGTSRYPYRLSRMLVSRKCKYHPWQAYLVQGIYAL